MEVRGEEIKGEGEGTREKEERREEARGRREVVSSHKQPLMTC